MRFSIVTPSFRGSAWLKLCIASVADQQGVQHEHIVQDSCSDDGTLDWLPHDPRVTAYIEKDEGMYDAINRGFRRATGDFLAYLNCDEQLLPGALAAVAEFFTQHPEVEVVVADTVVVDEHGGYICHRHALVPAARDLWVRFPVLSCALFLRRSVIDRHKIFFDPRYRWLGDVHFVMELVKHGVPMALLPRFTSVFTETGGNMGLHPDALRESRERASAAPVWVRPLRALFLVQHRLRLLARGAYTQPPFSYALYTPESPEARVVQHAARPTGRWPGR
jgi:glycosyltransferase involved in cell wall biosynthesis